MATCINRSASNILNFVSFGGTFISLRTFDNVKMKCMESDKEIMVLRRRKKILEVN